jgi:hypothetical protein
MGLKEFFKIEKSKIIVFVILVLISLFLGFLVIASQRMCEVGGNCGINYIQLVFFIILIIIAGWPFLLMLGIENLIFARVDWIHAKDIPFLIAAFILSILYLYFLSCLSVFIYRKIKR